MTTRVGFAGASGVDIGPISLETIRHSEADQAAALRAVHRHVNGPEQGTVLAMLGLEPPHPGRE